MVALCFFKKFLRSFLLVFLGFSFFNSSAWWGTGHQITAIIAWNLLTEDASSRLKSVLAGRELKDVVNCPDRAKEKVAYSTDVDLSGKKAYCCDGLVKMEGKGSWHRIFIPAHINVFNQTSSDLLELCGQDCILSKIDKDLGILESVSKPPSLISGTCSENVFVESIINLAHFVGDLTCPPHSIYEKGNILLAMIHWIWDGLLDGFEGFDSLIPLKEEEIEARAKNITNSISTEEFEKWCSMSFEDILRESFVLEQEIYSDFFNNLSPDFKLALVVWSPRKGETRLPKTNPAVLLHLREIYDFFEKEEYRKQYIIHVERQLKIAAVKLTCVFNSLFGNKKKGELI